MISPFNGSGKTATDHIMPSSYFEQPSMAFISRGETPASLLQNRPKHLMQRLAHFLHLRIGHLRADIYVDGAAEQVE